MEKWEQDLQVLYKRPKRYEYYIARMTSVDIETRLDGPFTSKKDAQRVVDMFWRYTHVYITKHER